MSERAGRRGDAVGSFKRQGLSGEVEVPVALERLLLKAAAEPEFRGALLADRLAAAAAAGVVLTASEETTLLALPRPTLAAMTTGLAPAAQRNRRFASKVAAAVAGTAFVTAACYACGGIDPEMIDAAAAVDARPPDAASADAGPPDAAASADAEEPDAT
jgi:hypothetical protein